LIISGEKDHTVPWAIANALQEAEEEQGRHRIVEISGRGHAPRSTAAEARPMGPELSEVRMKLSARNRLSGTVVSIRRGGRSPTWWST
jgi:hypothetical protein